jgi:ribosomal protein L24
MVTAAPEDNDSNGGLNGRMGRLWARDHQAQLPSAAVPRRDNIWSGILPPQPPDAGPEKGKKSLGLANGIVFGRPRLVNKTEHPRMQAFSNYYDAIREKQERRRRVLAEHAEANAKRADEGLSPLEAPSFDDAETLPEDPDHQVRDIEADARAEAWATRVPCWVRVNHGRYSGDVGLLVKVILKVNSYGLDQYAGAILMVARLPEYPAQPPSESYSTTGSKPRTRFPRAHIRTAIAERLFPSSEYTFERDTSKDDLCRGMKVYKFRRQPREGVPPLVEWLVGGDVNRSFSFAMRTPWVTAEDRQFSACPKPTDGEILDFNPFALRYLFEDARLMKRFDDTVRPRHMNMGWKSVDNEAAAHRELSWDVRIGDRVRVAQGEPYGLIGLVHAVFPQVGVAHLRPVDKGAGHVSVACVIDDLDRHLSAGDTVSFTRAGDTATGLVVFVDDVKTDGKPMLQMAHLFIRPDEPLVCFRASEGRYLAEVTQVDVWSRTCRAVEVAHDPTVGEAPTLLHRGQPIDDSRPEESDDVRMLDDLHLDLTKHHDIELRPDGPGRPHVLVNGAPLGHKDRVSVERGKLTGRWGVVLDIKWDLPSLVLERYGEDFSGRELVRYLSTVE